MTGFALPQYWATFLLRHGVEAADFEVPEKLDASGLGAELRLMSSDQAREEAEECYPGIAALAEGYVPVGICLLGSGDPYFIRSSDGAGGPLYRIHHDALDWNEGRARLGRDAVVKVLDSYEALLSHRT